jgi:hypothetical protein
MKPMRRSYILAAAIGVLASTVGCGDNSKACGPGTIDMKGYCVPSAACGAGTTLDPMTNQCVLDGSSCSTGTVFDPTSGTCVIAGTACQDGTVLIGDACVDPTAGLTIDLDEGQTEPNGDGVIEQSTHDAGTIVLKQPGSPFVIHGRIAPFQDADGDGQLDPDVDTYELSVGGPVLLQISADGVGGIDGGFLAIAKADTLAGWTRFGLNVATDTSLRQVYLPAAGTYKLAIADTRTLLQYSTGGLHAAAPGPGEYYISITQLAMPAPTALAVAGNVASASGTLNGDVQFFTMAMGSGINRVTLAMPSPQAAGSPVVLDSGALRDFAAAAVAGGSAQLYIAGFAATDTALIAVDDVYNYANMPIGYTLVVHSGDAQPLSTTGGAATQTATTNVFDPGDPMTLQQYYFDVAGAQTVGVSISWSDPVIGSLYDGDLQLVARFTALGGTTTWSSYAGLTRVLTGGRYYFFVYDPAAVVGTTQLTATSRIDQLTPVAIAEGPTGTGTQTLDPNYLANTFTYAAGADPWQTFDSTGTSTGGQNVIWYDPATTFGRLDALSTSGGTSPGNNAGTPLQPIFQHSYAETGGPIGRILLDDGTPTYFVEVATPSGNGTFQLAFDKRAITDLGMLAKGSTTPSPGHVLDATTVAGYFLFHTGAGNSATVTVHSDSAALDTQFQRVAADESALGPLVNAASGDDIETFVQAGTGWTAFVVTAAANAGSNMYDVSVGIAP